MLPTIQAVGILCILELLQRGLQPHLRHGKYQGTIWHQEPFNMLMGMKTLTIFGTIGKACRIHRLITIKKSDRGAK